jgi:hypothetical protein
MKYPGYSDFNFRIQVNLIIHYSKNAIFSEPECLLGNDSFDTGGPI